MSILENIIGPEMVLYSEYQCCNLEYNHKNPSLLGGGTLSGQVCTKMI